MHVKALATLWLYSVVFMMELCRAEKEVNPEDVDKSKKAIDTRLKEMGNAGMIIDDNLDKKLNTIQTSLDSLKAKKVPGLKEANAINNAINGLPELVAGIQTRNYVSIIMGSLKVTAAICVLIPPLAPFATVGIIVLNSLTTILSLFSTSKKQVTEDPLKSALRNFRVTGLKDEIAAISYSWNVMITSVARFEDFINDGEVITSDLAMEFYSNSFRSVGIFGKLKLLIVENCITADHNIQKAGAEYMKTCLDLATKYTQLTAIRSMMLIRMAGIVNVAESYYKNTKRDPVKEKEMMLVRVNFIHLASKQRDIDKVVLGFLADPLNSFRSKRVIYEMFEKPYDYTELLNYLHTLDNQFEALIDNDNVILCPEEKLGGLCHQMPVSGGFKNWDFNLVPTKSWFVPKGLRFIAEDSDSKKYGPFIGMNVYSPTTIANLAKLKVDEDPNKMDALTYVMMCNSEGWCDSIKTEEGEAGQKIDNYHGVNYNTLKTVYVPPGFKVDVYYKDGSEMKKHGGPFYGPVEQKNIQNCHNYWNVINMTPLEPGVDGTKMVKLCSPKDGFCTQIEPGAEMETEETGIFDFFKSSPIQCKPSLEYGKLDMEIPQGRRVTISKGAIKLGPFTGPADYPGLAVETLSIKVDDLWIDSKKAKKHRIHRIAAQPQPFLYEKAPDQIGVSQKRSHYHRKYQPMNQTIEAVL